MQSLSKDAETHVLDSLFLSNNLMSATTSSIHTVPRSTLSNPASKLYSNTKTELLLCQWLGS